jgi:hypothetical protein
MILTAILFFSEKFIFLEYVPSGTFSVHGFLLHIYTQAIFIILFDTRITGTNEYIFSTGSTAPLGPGLFFSFMIILQMVGLLGRVISSSQGLYLNRGQHKQNKNIHTPNIHALRGIRTHDPSFRASEDSSNLRPLGYCDRPNEYVYMS